MIKEDEADAVGHPLFVIGGYAVRLNIISRSDILKGTLLLLR